MADYSPLFGVPDATHFFQGARGSIYVRHADGSTTGFREPSNMPGTGMQQQPRSYKTLYTDKNNAVRINDWLNNEFTGTRMIPQISDGELKGMHVVATDNVYYPKSDKFNVPERNYKAGQVLDSIPVTAKPQEGLLPLEFNSPKAFESPLGQKTGRLVHFGNEIKEVMPIAPKSGMGGKLGIAAALAAGAGSASAGDFKQAAGDVAESFLPWGATPSMLNTNEDQELANRNQMPPTIDKARGGMIDKPLQGNWKII
jgi:hypothetical protein